MKFKHVLLQTTFDHTTVKLDEVMDYLSSDPGYVTSSVESEDDLFDSMTAYHADYVEFWLRWYIAGCVPTLRQVFAEIRAFMAFDEAVARAVIPVLLEKSIHATLLEKEWYEWMPRYERARKRIRSTFGIGEA